jgi:hypothetical protein
MVRGKAAGSSALLVALMAPAAAQAAPVLEPLKPCYVTAKTEEGKRREGMQIMASGFTPNSTVDLSVDGRPYRNGNGLQVDQHGRLPVGSIPALFSRKGRRRFDVTLTEVGNPANTVTARTSSTALGVELKPAEARPSDRIRFKGSGFTKAAPIWAHYLRGGTVRKTVRMARRPRACGSFKVHRRQIPITRPKLGKWTIQFDQSRRYVDPAAEKFVFVRIGIRLRLVPR